MADDSSLTVSLRHRQGAHTLDVDFVTHASWTLLFGPSGSGKSTVLRAIAGFLTPHQGSVLFGNPAHVLLNTAKRVHPPPHLRPVRSAPQTPRLIPHRRVLANLRYGLGSGVLPSTQDEIVDRALDLFRLRQLVHHLPGQLSGGELQRVSVARAVLSAITFPGPGPALLLLDEPFSGLDTALRDDLAVQLRTWLRSASTPVLSVSHDVAEAFLLEAEVLRMNAGHIVDQGHARTVLAEERQRLLHHLGP